MQRQAIDRSFVVVVDSDSDSDRDNVTSHQSRVFLISVQMNPISSHKSLTGLIDGLAHLIFVSMDWTPSVAPTATPCTEGRKRGIFIPEQVSVHRQIIHTSDGSISLRSVGYTSVVNRYVETICSVRITSSETCTDKNMVYRSPVRNMYG